MVNEQETRGKSIEKNYNYFILISLIFGFIFMFAFYDFIENFNGILYPVFVISLFVISRVALKKLEFIKDFKENKQSFIYMGMALLLGISSNITTNLFVVFFNTVSIGILYGVSIIKILYPNKKLDLFKVIDYFIIMFFKTVASFYLPLKHFRTSFKNKKINLGKLKPIIKGIIFAILFLAIVVPLLISSDLIINNMVNHLTKNMVIPFSGGLKYFILTIIGTTGFYGLFCVISDDENFEFDNNIEKKEPISMITMTWFVAAVYLLYCLIQGIYLIGGNFFKLPAGLSYAEYARSGFFQLLAVVAMNLSLVLFCVNKIKEHDFLDIGLKIISGCTFIMIASATYRMILYIGAYHLTFIRVLVLWFLAVLTICMIATVYYINNKNFYIYKFLFLTCMISYIIFGFMKVDYVIARYNINHIDIIEGEDIHYLLGLSYDAVPAIKYMKEEQILSGDEYYSTNHKELLRNYFYDIYNHYDNSIRKFNFSRWRAYKYSEEYLE